MISGVDPDQAPALLTEILDDLPAFWGERDLRSLHHPVWLRQFGSDALIDREDGLLLAYLLGCVTTHGLAYVHLIAARSDRQGQGLGRRLYQAFLDRARAQGAERVQAVTTPSNHGSIAFHQRLGFTSELVADYAGPDQPRLLFTRSTAR